jgi:hypothetical protein
VGGGGGRRLVVVVVVLRVKLLDASPPLHTPTDTSTAPPHTHTHTCTPSKTARRGPRCGARLFCQAAWRVALALALPPG